MDNLPKRGYTEFNEYTYELLKPYLSTHSNYGTKEDIKRIAKQYISWNLHTNKKEWNSYYLCNKSNRDYYNWEELTKIKRIYECW